MTLQEHYYAIKSGKGNKDQFLKQARNLFPEYFTQYTDFNTAANVLKSKQIISEAAGGVVSKGFDIYDWKKILAEEAKAEEKETSKEVLDDQNNAYNNSDMKNADNVNFNEIMKGFYAELRDEKNAGKTGDEIKAMVVKNLAKDPLFYTKDGMFGEKGVGYTTEAPGLGQPKELKGKHKSSGYGDLDADIKIEKVKSNVQDSLSDKEAKTTNPSKVKEMEVTPKSASGVKRMPMPGAEKKMKLQENINDLTSFHKGSHSTGRPDFNKMTADQIEDYLKQDKDKVGGLYGRSLDIVKSILKKKREKEKLKEAMYQGPVSIKGKVKGDGEQKAPRALFLDKDLIKQINDKFPNSIKLISKGDKQVYMYVSAFVKNALDELERGRTTREKEKRKSPLSDALSEKLPAQVRGKIKKEINSKPDPGLKMHYVNLNIVPTKDKTGYFILTKGEFDPLVTEEQNQKLTISGTDKAMSMLKSELKNNGVKFETDRNKVVVNDSPKAKMAIRMVKERVGMQSIKLNENLVEQKLRSLIRNVIKETLNEYGEDSGGQDMTSGMYNRSITKKDQGNKDFIDKGYEDFYDDVPFEACPYEKGYNKYYKMDLAKLWQMGWKEAEAEEKGDEVNLNEISPELFKRATDVSRERGQDRRTSSMGESFFSKFKGKPLMGGTITNIRYVKPQQGNYEEVIIEIEVPSSVIPGETKSRYIYYDVRKDQWDIDKEITRADARVLSLIAQHINPNTRYKSGGEGFQIKGY